MEFHCNPGATGPEINNVSQSIRAQLPQDYLDFMRRCNGGEGFVGDEYLMLCCIGELERFNREYEVCQYLSKVLLFGSNGGGEAFGFRRSGAAVDIVRVPFVGMEDDLCTQVAATFGEFIRGVDI